MAGGRKSLSGDLRGMNSIQAGARQAAGLLGRESWLVRRLRPHYESLLDWTSAGKGISWEINGETYRIDPHQRHRLGKHYDAPVATFLRERVKPGAVCVDVGANVGIYVLQFARWAGPTGRIVAFEPDPNARIILERHIRLNGLISQVEVVPAAVGASVGDAVLYAAEAHEMSRLGAPNRQVEDRVCAINVRVTTLDEYCKSEGLKPDWLFMDIEGFEIAALAGARQLIKNRGRDLNIVVEMHPNVWASANTTRVGAEELLADLGLCAVPLTGQTDPLNDYGLVHLEHD